MCNLYSHTKGPKAIRDIANAMGGDWLDKAGGRTRIMPPTKPRLGRDPP
jgi:hypothetical protein